MNMTRPANQAPDQDQHPRLHLQPTSEANTAQDIMDAMPNGLGVRYAQPLHRAIQAFA